MSRVLLQAHKGVECEYPENTMASFRAACLQGYEKIELDVRVTADNVFVLCHDNSVNRTGRKQDGSLPEETRKISEMTYRELLAYDFGIRFSPQFRGEPIPLFADVLHLAKEYNVCLKIDNKIREFSDYQLDLLFSLIRNSGARVTVSCWDTEIVRRVLASIPDACVSFDGLYDEALLSEISKLAGKDRFEDWLPIDRERSRWAPEEWFPTPEKAEIIRSYAKICLWSIGDPETFRRACEEYRPFAVETNGLIKPKDAEFDW